MIIQCKYQLEIILDHCQIWHPFIFHPRCTHHSIKSTTIQAVRTVRYVWISSGFGSLYFDFDCFALQLMIHLNIKIAQSPVTTSPATLSPTSIPTRHPTARFPYSPVSSPGEAVSPTHSHGTSQVSCPTSSSYIISCLVFKHQSERLIDRSAVLCSMLLNRMVHVIRSSASHASIPLITRKAFNKCSNHNEC